MGCLNVCGCGADEKKCMIVDMFKERKMDVLALSETTVKGEGEREWEGEQVIVSGVPDRCRAREGVAVVIKRRLWGSIIILCSAQRQVHSRISHLPSPPILG